MYTYVLQEVEKAQEWFEEYSPLAKKLVSHAKAKKDSKAQSKTGKRKLED